MSDFQDKIAKIKAAQAEKDEQKAGAARAEREARRNELAAQRDKTRAELAQAEANAGEADRALEEADAFVKEQGENLDPEVAEQIESLKQEAQTALAHFDEVKARMVEIELEIANLENEGISPGPEKYVSEKGQGEESTNQTEAMTSDNTPETAQNPDQLESGEAAEETALLKEAEQFLADLDRYQQGEEGQLGEKINPLVVYLHEKYPGLEESDKEAWLRKGGEIADAANFINFQKTAYGQKHPEITLGQYKEHKGEFELGVKFARKVERVKAEWAAINSLTVVTLNESGEPVQMTVDLDKLDDLKEEERSKFLTGLQKYGPMGPIKLSKLIEKGFIKPEQLDKFLEKNDQTIIDKLSCGAIKKLCEDKTAAERIKEELRGLMKDYIDRRDLGMSEEERIKRLGEIIKTGVLELDSDMRQVAIDMHMSDTIEKDDLKSRIEQFMREESNITLRIGPKYMRGFIENNLISHKKLLELLKNLAETPYHFGASDEKISEISQYKNMGIISQEEADKILEY